MKKMTRIFSTRPHLSFLSHYRRPLQQSTLGSEIMRGGHLQKKSFTSVAYFFFFSGILGFANSAAESTENQTDNSDSLSADSQLRITNLVFKGGGPKGIAFKGVLEALENNQGRYLPDVKRVGGSSAGAITAALIAAGYHSGEIREKISTQIMLSFLTSNLEPNEKEVVASLLTAYQAPGGRYFSFPKLRTIKAGLQHPVQTFKLFSKAYNNQGLSDGEYFRDWLNSLLTEKVVEIELAHRCNTQPNVDREKESIVLREKYNNLTYGQLTELIEAESHRKEKHYKHLYVVEAHNAPVSGKLYQRISTSEVLDYYANEDPTLYDKDLIIADSVRVSMSIQYAFTHGKLGYKDDKGNIIKGDPIGSDGGNLENYKYRLFDQQQYLTFPDPKKSPKEEVKNHETLGFVLVDKRASKMSRLGWLWHNAKVTYYQKKYKDGDRAKEKSHYMDRQLAEAVVGDPNEIPRHVIVDTRGVSLIDFNLSNDKQIELMQSGYDGTTLYLESRGKELHKYQLGEDKANKNKIKIYLKRYAEHSNLDDYSPNICYVNTHHESKLLSTFYPLKNNHDKHLMGISIEGMSGMGKSELAYHMAHQYMEEHFWHTWRMEQLSESSRLHVWIFDATNSGTLWNSFRELPLAVKNQASPHVASLDAIHDTHNKLTQFPNFLWVFDNVGHNDSSASKGDIHISDYIPKATTNGYLWVTTQNSLKNTRGLQMENINLNEGMLSGEAIDLLNKRSSRKYTYREAQHVLEALEHVPLSIALAGEFIRREASSLSDFLTLFTSSKKQLTREFATLSQQVNYRGGTIAATLLSLNSIANVDSGEADEVLGLIFLSSKLHVSHIPMILLLDYIKSLHPEFSNEYCKIYLNQLIRNSGSLLIPLSAGADSAIRMHKVTRSLVNNEWSLADPFFLSSRYHQKQSMALKTAARLLSNHFTNKDMIEEKRFGENLCFLPHVDALLCLCNDFEKINDLALINVLIPLYKTRCFMYDSMGSNKSQVPKDAMSVIDKLGMFSKLDILHDSPEIIYKKLSLVDSVWPHYYAAMFYILGRSRLPSTSVLTKADYYQRCKSLCSVIEQKTGHCPDYYFLSKRGLLSLRSDKRAHAGIEELLSLLADYKALLSDSKSYLTDDGSPSREFDKDPFNLRVCNRKLALVCITLGERLETPGEYFQQAEHYLLNVLAVKEERYEHEAENYNVLGQVYLNKKNPHRDLEKATRSFQTAYDLEIAKNSGSGKRNFPLADAAYGLAIIALEKGDLKRAREKAQLCSSIRQEIKSTQLEEADALLIQIGKLSSPRVLRDSPILSGNEVVKKSSEEPTDEEREELKNKF
ncbi:MAG: patatin-like phospholipase family protein [Gammaproteobacteria bacterium]|nr:patatin-like phospholipase family protein [Gammaproteobacteria bacterium]